MCSHPGWFNLFILGLLKMQQVCSLTQPHSNQTDSGQVRLLQPAILHTHTHTLHNGLVLPLFVSLHFMYVHFLYVTNATPESRINHVLLLIPQSESHRGAQSHWETWVRHSPPTHTQSPSCVVLLWPIIRPFRLKGYCEVQRRETSQNTSLPSAHQHNQLPVPRTPLPPAPCWQLISRVANQNYLTAF